jgi:sec-independent protein translocase protein TatA
MPELLLILAIVVLLFGGNKLPQLGQGLGEALRGFKKAYRDTNKEEDERPALSEHSSTSQASAAKQTETAAKR